MLQLPRSCLVSLACFDLGRQVIDLGTQQYLVCGSLGGILCIHINR
jgi:hypothetical protein